MEAKPLEVVLVRHGETEWSRTGLHTGRTDIPLTDLGRRQADQLAGMLEGRAFELVMSSPLSRARETYERAAIAAPAEIIDDLLEWDYGTYEGVSTPETRQEIPDWSVWTHPIIQGETVEAVGDRADSVIGRLFDATGDIALFAHGHLLRILAARWLGLPADAGRHLALNTATISTLGFERENRVIRRWNEGCHLRGIEATP
jgi:broad specificity phosphatase PhoE